MVRELPTWASNDREIAKHYDAQARIMIQGAVLDDFFRWLYPRNVLGALGEGLTVLDIGCGDGDITQRIAAMPNIASIVPLDISPTVIRKVEEWYNLPGVVALAEDLPFEDGSFDVALLICTLEHLREPMRAIEEAERVGRWVVAVVPAIPDDDPDHLSIVPLGEYAKSRGGQVSTDGLEVGVVVRGKCG